MKFKTNFETMKQALTSIGKAIPKRAIETPGVRIIASKEKQTLRLEYFGRSNNIQVAAEIPAEVEEGGIFNTAYADIGVLSVISCDGNISGSTSDASLILRYRGGKSVTRLKKLNDELNPVSDPSDGLANVVLPAKKLKEMFNDVSFIINADANSSTHVVKLEIADDVEGILKFTMSACDAAGIAVRTAYAAKNGDYTGSVTITPETLKLALDIVDKADENVKVSFADDRVYMSAENTCVTFMVLAKPFPDIKPILDNRKCAFKWTIDTEMLSESIDAILYSQSQKLSGDVFDRTLSMTLTNGNCIVKCIGSNQDYECNLDVEMVGEKPFNKVLFNTKRLKNVVSKWPAEKITFGGNSYRAPFWLIYGDNEEYIYCILPCIAKGVEETNAA